MLEVVDTAIGLHYESLTNEYFSTDMFSLIHRLDFEAVLEGAPNWMGYTKVSSSVFDMSV